MVVPNPLPSLLERRKTQPETCLESSRMCSGAFCFSSRCLPVGQLLFSLFADRHQHFIRPAHWTECPVHLSGPEHQEYPHLAIHHCLPDGWVSCRGELHQRSDHDQCFVCRQSCTLRRNETAVHSRSGGTCTFCLRQVKQEQSAVDSCPLHRPDQRSLFWSKFHRRWSALVMASEVSRNRRKLGLLAIH